MSKYCADKFPDIFDNFLKLTSSVYGYITRQSNLLYVPKIRLDIGKFSLRFHGTKIWNSLPPELRLIHNISKFKIQFRNFLLSKY